MALSTLGTASDTAARVAATIDRRGSDGTPLAFVWTSLALGGIALAVIGFFVTWYAAVRTATALYSGWMPAIGLTLVIAGGLLLVGKQVGLAKVLPQVDSDLFFAGSLIVGATILMLRQIFEGGLHGLVFLLVIPAFFLGRAALKRRGTTSIEIEQVALGLATYGGGLIVAKRLIDADNATNGFLWGAIAAAAVIIATLAACQYLGILSMFQVALFVTLAISMGILGVLIAQVIGDGWSVLSGRLGEFLTGTLRSRSDDSRLGISQGLIGSFWIVVFVALLSFPVGIAAAVYLEEYAPRSPMGFRESMERRRLFRWFGSRVTTALDIVVRNLAGVPSVVYGLLGLFLFVRGGSSLFAGGMTLAILVLPIVVITSAEAVRAVPQSLREGAYGVGATKWEVIRSQVLPFAAPGILTGTLLALARAVGEAAPLILVGAVTGRLAPRPNMFSGADEFFGQFADRFTAMPIVIVGWVQNSGRDAGFAAAAAAAIVVLIVLVIMMNSVAVLLRNHFEKKRA